jgi:hypothetical protein
MLALVSKRSVAAPRTIMEADAIVDGLMRRMKLDEDYKSISPTLDSISSGSQALGSHISLSILSTLTQETLELRRSVQELISVVRSSEANAQRRHEEAEANADRRHKELIMVQTRLLDALVGSGTPLTPTQTAKKGGKSKSEYYFSTSKVSSRYHIVACVIMQLMRLSMAHAQKQELSVTQSTSSTEFTAMATLVRELSKIEYNGETVTVPQMNEAAAVNALNIAASQSPGHDPTLGLSQIITLNNECSTIMACVEAMHLRFVACEGCVSPHQRRLLMAIQYPYVADDRLVFNINAYMAPITFTERAAGKLSTSKKVELGVKILSGRAPHVAIRDFVAAEF